MTCDAAPRSRGRALAAIRGLRWCWLASTKSASASSSAARPAHASAWVRSSARASAACTVATDCPCTIEHWFSRDQVMYARGSMRGRGRVHFPRGHGREAPRVWSRLITQPQVADLISRYNPTLVSCVLYQRSNPTLKQPNPVEG